MKYLLNTLYVLSEESWLSLKGGDVVVWKEDEKVGSIPLHTLEAIKYFGYRAVSPALMGACADQQVDFSFFTQNGRFLARTVGAAHGNIFLRHTQFQVADDSKESLKYAKHFILGKVANSLFVLDRACRDHALQVDVETLSKTIAFLKQSRYAVLEAKDYKELLGVEGDCARRYFEVFSELILTEDPVFIFQGRNRRPPLDPVNALLSFAYSLLAGDCAAALEGVGLDPYEGFYHRERPGRESLALDCMEELRAPFADRLVISSINLKIFKEEDFEFEESGAVMLNDDGRKKFLSRWQTKKQEAIVHPFTKERIPWGLVPHVQAQLLARSLRGDLNGYPPFFWK